MSNSRRHEGQHAPACPDAEGNAPADSADPNACAHVQFDDECRTAAALRLAEACTRHPAGQAGVARAIGMGTQAAVVRFHRYCTGEKTAPSSTLDKIARRCPRVWARYLDLLTAEYAPKAAPVAADRAIADHRVAHAKSTIVQEAALADGVIEPHEAPAIVEAFADEREKLDRAVASVSRIRSGK